LLTSSLDASIRLTSIEIPASFDDAGRKRGKSTKRLIGRADDGLPQDYFRHSRTLLTPVRKGVHAFAYGTTHGRHQLASCGLGRQIFVWSLESGDFLKALEWHGANVTCLQYDSHSDLLISLDAAGEMCTWDFATLARVHAMPLRPDAVERPAAILYEKGQQVGGDRSKWGSTATQIATPPLASRMPPREVLHAQPPSFRPVAAGARDCRSTAAAVDAAEEFWLCRRASARSSDNRQPPAPPRGCAQ
jgi:hypothetical protein